MYTAPTELPPIAIKALAYYEAGLTDEHVRDLTKDLESMFGDFKALYDAVHGVGAVMLFAKQQNKKEAAETLTALIRHARPRFLAWNQEVKEQIGDEALLAARRMTALTGKGASRNAPIIGAKPLAGALRLAELRPAQGRNAPPPPVVRRARG